MRSGPVVVPVPIPVPSSSSAPAAPSVSVERTYERYRSEEPVVPDTETEVLVRSMANIAKADGSISAEERVQIIGKFEELSDEEQTFLDDELAGDRIDVVEFADEVPKELAEAAYMFAVMAVVVDTTSEREYLKDFARALKISDLDRDSIHVQLSVEML